MDELIVKLFFKIIKNMKPRIRKPFSVVTLSGNKNAPLVF